MPYADASCQLPRARTGDSRTISPANGGIPCQKNHHSTAPDALRVAPGDQWIDTTSGRIATCPHSWMQSVHWVGGSGLYKPSRTHGPGWGPTTILIAKEISALGECRPSVAYLARKLKISERTVQYHLGMLREAGLLAYRSKGTRISRGVNRASVFERIIPVAFDEALGIRTIQRDETAPAYTRVPVGIAEKGRALIGKLAKKAARKTRRRPRKRTRSAGSLCTPMQGGTSAGTTTGTTSLPSDTDLASGDHDSPTPQQPKRATPVARKLNQVGRRKQLARELITQVPWLAGASRDRIAWIARHVADAGWTVLEVQAVAEAMPLTRQQVRRPSGILAHRLKGAHLLYNTPGKRRTAVLAWQESRAAEHARHSGYETLGERPARASVQRILREAVTRSRPQPSPADLDDAVEYHCDETHHVDIEAIDPADVIDLRAAAEANLHLIREAIPVMGEAAARRLYTNRLVDRALAAHSTNARITQPWQEATTYA
ncbi:helix-turn-helix domain-containing protein [Streptomyces hebeiensis]